MFKKIIFLIKSNTRARIILKFITCKFLRIFNKSNVKKEKAYYKSLLNNLTVSSDFFSTNVYYFFKYIKNYKNFNYLEIGSYEGCSAVYLANRFKESKIYCVDIWERVKEEYNENINFNHIEKNFDINSKNYSNVFKIKKYSDEFFLDNSQKFDVIYVDGHHLAEQVYKDAVNSWNVLKSRGLIIFDDYIWKNYNDITNNPCHAINKFLEERYDSLKILEVTNSQIFIKKIV